jgi:hypothetical protein
MSTFPCLVRFVSGSGQVRYRLGERLADRYLEFVAGRCRLAALQPPSLLETAAALPRVPGFPRLGVLRRLRPARHVQRSVRLSRAAGRMPAAGDPRPGGSRVHCRSLGGGGARLCPSGLATSTPQTFPVAYRRAVINAHRKFPPRHYRRDAPRPAQIRQVRAGGVCEGRKAPVPLVLLSATLAGPAPSGSAGTSRLCQGCSRPPRHHPDQAARSFTALLRQDGGEGLSPPLEQTAPHGAAPHTATRRSPPARNAIVLPGEPGQPARRCTRSAGTIRPRFTSPSRCPDSRTSAAVDARQTRLR